MTAESDQPTPTPEGGGEDYSYDLAHEVPEAVRQPSGPARRTSAPAGRPAPADESGDYSYDLAHEVPPSGS